jgi:hypothetical protein
LCHYKKVVYLIKSYVSAFCEKKDFSWIAQPFSAVPVKKRTGRIL